MARESIEAKGLKGEQAFQRWLDDQYLAYVHVRQDPASFASLFRNIEVKRPDFLVLLESIGLLAVDVKNKALHEGNFYSLDHSELRPVLAFERLFRIPVWYAYRNETAGTWCWISALKAVEVGEPRTDAEGLPFLALHRDQFAVVTSNRSCPLTVPQKLTPTELMNMKDMVLSPAYRHMSIRAPALHAQRVGEVIAHPVTWLKIIRERGWKQPRMREHPECPTVGIRATKPNEACRVAPEDRLAPGTAKSDVFLVEGSQLRYGSKTAWQVATR
jgi:hypothetical protein